MASSRQRFVVKTPVSLVLVQEVWAHTPAGAVREAGRYAPPILTCEPDAPYYFQEVKIGEAVVQA
jgi:hypothetical protein